MKKRNFRFAIYLVWLFVTFGFCAEGLRARLGIGEGFAYAVSIGWVIAGCYFVENCSMKKEKSHDD